MAKLYLNEDYIDSRAFLDSDRDLMREAMDQKTSPQRLKELAGSAKMSVICEIAKNKNAPAELLFDIFKKCETAILNGFVRCALAKNENLPIEIINMLKEDDQDHVRSCLAGNPFCPKDVLIYLASDTNHFVKCEVAENPNSPLEALEILMEEDEIVKTCLAKSRNLTDSMLEVLAKDVSGTVRYSIACNDICPRYILGWLINDPSEVVRNRALAHGSLREMSCFY